MSASVGPSSDGRLRAIDPDRGTNQNGVRLYNERLVLSLIRRNLQLSKADLARLTGLSAQTISVIVKQLETDGLVRKEEPLRGRVGQPSVPFSLNPNGVLAYGLKIGRRSADLVLIDFLGKVRRSLHTTYAFPEPNALLEFTARGLETMGHALSATEQARVVGLGIASPNELWNWPAAVGAPPGSLDIWRDTDIRADVARFAPWPVYLCNDATAACAAELVFGENLGLRDFLYFFIGSFIGGGVVQNGTLFPGSTGNAGAVASMPVPTDGGEVRQLLNIASLYTLEQRLVSEGKKAGWLWSRPDAWEEAGSELDDWIEQAAPAIAFSIVAAASVIDFQAAVIDGAFPADVRRRLVKSTTEALARRDLQGLSPLTIYEGTIGASAREIGGASLPLFANFAMDREVLFTETN